MVFYGPKTMGTTKPSTWKTTFEVARSPTNCEDHFLIRVKINPSVIVEDQLLALYNLLEVVHFFRSSSPNQLLKSYLICRANLGTTFEIIPRQQY